MNKQEQVKLFLNNINKHILKKQISERAWTSFEVRFALKKLADLGIELDFKRGKFKEKK